jgi:hypothetical protein
MICSLDVVVKGGGADLPTDSSAPVGVTPSVEASAGMICSSEVDATMPFPFVLAVVSSIVVFDFCTPGASLYADLLQALLPGRFLGMIAKLNG